MGRAFGVCRLNICSCLRQVLPRQGSGSTQRTKTHMNSPDPIHNILPLLHGVKKTANGWEAHCPGHEDQHASLSIARGEGGRVLLHCHAGCSSETIATALGLKLADLFQRKDAAPKFTRPTLPTPPESEAEVPRDLEKEAEFSVNCRDDLSANEDALAYLWRRRGIGCKTASDWALGVTDIRHDTAGVIVGATWTLPILSHVSPRPLLGVKLHRDPPRPGQSKGGWLVRGGAALFPLPEAQGLRRGAEIILSEGELKALAYIEAGLPATSPTTGAATRWTPDMAARFAGLTVVIDADHEDSKAARDFVSNAARALWRVARSVEVCEVQQECEVTA